MQGLLLSPLTIPNLTWLHIPNTGKDWGKEEKWAAGDEMVGWYHQLNGHEFEQTLRDSEGRETLQPAAVHGVTESWTRLSDWTITLAILPGDKEW